MKKVLLLPVVCASAFAQTDCVLDIAEPTKNVVGVSYTAWAGKLVVNVDGANPEDIGADPASSSFTVPDVIYGAKSGSVFTSNRDNASGGVLQPGIAAMTFNMNSGVIKSFIGAVESSKIYGDVEMNVRGGLIYTKPGEYDILATALSPTDSASSGVAIYGDSKLNFGSSSVSGQPRIYGSVFAMGAGTLHGDTHVNISGGTYGSYNISIGVFAGSAWGGVINGSTNLHITGGDFSEAYVYGGSFGEDSTQMSLIKGSTNVTIDGGKFSTVYSGNYKFANLAISGDANMTVNSGDFENAYGGGGTVGGDVRTEINGGTIGSAFGNYGNVFGDSVLVLNGGIVGKAYAASYGNIQGTSTLRVNGGTVTGDITASHQGAAYGDVNIVVEKGKVGGDIIGIRGNAYKDVNIVFVGDSRDIDFKGAVKTYYANEEFYTKKFEGKARLLFGTDEKAFTGAFGGSVDGYGNMDIVVGGGSDVAFSRTLEGISGLVVGENAEASFSGEASVSIDSLTLASNSRVILDGTSLTLGEGGVLSIMLGSDYDITQDGYIDMSDIFTLENGGSAIFSGLSAADIVLLNMDGGEYEGLWDVVDLGGGMFGINVHAVPEPAAFAALFGLAAMAVCARRGRFCRK